MTRYPRKLKRIKRVQEVRRPVPSYSFVLPVKHPELFADTKVAERERLKRQLERQGWRKIEFCDHATGALTVYGNCLRDPSVLEGAWAGLYDLMIVEPNL
jgi:hypothetical protein